MRLTDYLKDRLFIIITSFFVYTIFCMIFYAFHINQSIVISISIVYWLFILVITLWDYFRKYKFYQELLVNLDQLEKKYLILETIKSPDFYEGKLFIQAMYDINKSMIENVKEYELNINDFKEYVEMWIHEVKLPISSLILMTHNHRNDIDKKYIEQINRLDNYTDQILYYVRSENAEKDYLIKETSLKKVIKKVAMKNKDYLLESHIDFKVENINYNVLTDSKWLEFMLNQIISNSIKYKRPDVESYIYITATKEENMIILSIKDNGIGIPMCDLSYIFDKSFTGINGRIHSKSTGMGLYIVKKLCQQLGHKIEAESEINEFTVIKIVFSINDFYKFE